jgi:hypothetical protein
MNNIKILLLIRVYHRHELLNVIGTSCLHTAPGHFIIVFFVSCEVLTVVATLVVCDALQF